MHLARSYGTVIRATTRSRTRCRSFIRYGLCVRHASGLSAGQELPPVSLNSFPNPRAQNIAVLGGGITGLSAAYYLAKTIPHATVTVYEKQDRLGGWAQAEHVEVDGGQVLFEWGPRTLRPDMNGAGLATVQLVFQLGLYQDAILLRRDSAAALNRFVYYPDHLVRMPGPGATRSMASMFRQVYSLFTEPIYKGLVSSLFAEPLVKTRSTRLEDESVGSFIRRRFGRAAADNLASAVIHGIYAGDIYKLSMQTLLPSLWYMETRDSNGNGLMAEFVDLLLKQHAIQRYKTHYSQLLLARDRDQEGSAWRTNIALVRAFERASVYTFPRGIAYLVEKLEAALRQMDNVNIETNAAADITDYDTKNKKVNIRFGEEQGLKSYDYVVSTLRPRHLLKPQWSEAVSNSQILRSDLENSLRGSDKAVSVMVVNLYYANPDLLPPSWNGFGYLIPRSVDVGQNPERALGVIFGSASSGPRGANAVVSKLKPTQKELESLRSGLEGLRMLCEDKEQSDTQREMLRTDLKAFEAHYHQMLEEHESSQVHTIQRGQDTGPGTKLTVMMGGHWWDGWQESDLPSEQEAIDMAKSVVARHLRILEAPLVAKARLNRDCIPQYYVGYRERMAKVHTGLMKEYDGRLKLAGPWWQGGVGVNDSIQSARLTAFAIREQWDDKTGLEDYIDKEKWVLGDKRTRQIVMDPYQSN